MKNYNVKKEESTKKTEVIYVLDAEGFLVPKEIELKSRES